MQSFVLDTKGNKKNLERFRYMLQQNTRTHAIVMSHKQITDDEASKVRSLRTFLNACLEMAVLEVMSPKSKVACHELRLNGICLDYATASTLCTVLDFEVLRISKNNKEIQGRNTRNTAVEFTIDVSPICTNESSREVMDSSTVIMNRIIKAGTPCVVKLVLHDGTSDYIRKWSPECLAAVREVSLPLRWKTLEIVSMLQGLETLDLGEMDAIGYELVHVPDSLVHLMCQHLTSYALVILSRLPVLESVTVSKTSYMTDYHGVEVTWDITTIYGPKENDVASAIRVLPTIIKKFKQGLKLSVSAKTTEISHSNLITDAEWEALTRTLATTS